MPLLLSNLFHICSIVLYKYASRYDTIKLFQYIKKYIFENIYGRNIFQKVF